MANINKPTATQNKFSLLEFINSNTQTVLFFLLGLICFIIFKDFLLFRKVWLFKDIGSDSINIFYPWLVCLSDTIKADGVPGWSFSQGMGQNIFPIWLGDFFSDFLAYFDKNTIASGLAYMEVVKVILSGFVFYKFLKEIKLSNYVCLIFALLFAFCGFMLIGGTWVIFSVEALYISLVLYGFERWLNHKKYFWFVIGVMCLAFLQPFLLLPYSFVLGCYITARYFDVNDKGTKGFIIFLSKTVGLAAIGVAISAYQLLPDVLQYLESPRVGGESSFFVKLQKQPAFGLADEWLRFTTVFRSFGSDTLGNGNNFKGWQNYLEAPVFYCGIICLILFPQFFSSLNKIQKRIYGVITFLFCLPILFPYFRYLFWAFSGDYFRAFSLTITIFLLIFSARALDYIFKNNKINKKVFGVTILFLLILLYTPSQQYRSAVNTGLRMMVTVLLFVYSFFIFRAGTVKLLKNNFKLILLLICLVEVISFSHQTINDRDALRTEVLKEKIGYNDYTVDAVAYLKEKDKSFYRLNKDYSSGLAMHGSINDAKVQGFYGTSSYYSFNQKNYIKFLGDFGVIDVKDENSTRWAKGLVDRPILFSLASGKYWLSKRPDNAVASMGFDSIAKFGDVKVFKSKYSVPFGVTYDKIINEDDFKKLSTIQKDFCALRACVISKEDINNFSSLKSFNPSDTNAILSYDNFGSYIKDLKKDSLKVTKFSNDCIKGNISLNTSKVLFFSFPFDEGWKAKVNDVSVNVFRINAGLTGLILNNGANTVELFFEPRLKNKGKVISMFALLVFTSLIALEYYRKNKTRLN